MKTVSAKRSVLSRIALPTLTAALLAGAVAPAFAASTIEIEIAPPASRVVVAPPPRPGFVWAPGYYRWDGHQHVWVDGRFIRARRGFHWVPERWDERRKHYRFVPGHWERG